MRLITCLHEGDERLGAWIDGDRHVVDLARAAALRGASAADFVSMQSLIEAGPAAWDAARALIADAPQEAIFATADCRLLAPLPRPAQLRDFLCFPAHLQGARRVAGEQAIRSAADPAQKRGELEAGGYFDVPADYGAFPTYYTCNRFSVIGPDEDVVWPAFSRFIDYELEWAVVIGRAGRAIPRERAHEHIFGYTILNDWSARDEQMRVMGASLNLGPGQGKDFANSLGPCIVTADEIPEPYALAMSVRVNGEEVSVGSTAGMHWRFEDLISYLTRSFAIHPGEVLGSGTVGGGCALETGQRLKPGDVIDLEVERIGRLRNRVLAPHLGDGAGEVIGNMAGAMNVR